jgi:hypothetical protein
VLLEPELFPGLLFDLPTPLSALEKAASSILLFLEGLVDLEEGLLDLEEVLDRLSVLDLEDDC